MTEIKILGHKVSHNKIQMDESKVEAIQSIPYCKTMKDVQSFLGVTVYYRSYIKDYATIEHPLYVLTRKKTTFKFTDECKIAMDNLKQCLISFPILRQPDFNKEFILYTDASGYAMGAILGQKDDEVNEFVVEYASKLFNQREVYYSITEKELRAIVWALGYFYDYLVHSQPFTIITDHKALTWLLSLPLRKTSNGRLERWSITIN